MRVVVVVFATAALAIAAHASPRVVTPVAARDAPRATEDAMDLSRFIAPRALVFGDIEFMPRDDAERDGDDAERDCDDALCATVSLDVARTGERHEVRLCASSPGAKFTHARHAGQAVHDDDARARDGGVRKQFQFGLHASPIGGDAVVRVTADANAVVEPTEDGPGTGTPTSTTKTPTTKTPTPTSMREYTTTRAMTSDGTYVRLPVVIKRRRARGDGVFGMSRELATTIAIAAVLGAANVALGMWNRLRLRRLRRRRREKGSVELTREEIDVNAPDSADASLEELVGRLNYERVMTILEDQEERSRIPVPTSDFLVYARAPALEYGTREKTGDLVYDFLTAYPQSIAPTYLDLDDSDSEDEYLRDEFERRGDVDVFGNKLIPGRAFDLKIYGHGRQAGKLLLSHVLTHDSFCDAKLKNYMDHENEE